MVNNTLCSGPYEPFGKIWLSVLKSSWKIFIFSIVLFVIKIMSIFVQQKSIFYSLNKLPSLQEPFLDLYYQLKPLLGNPNNNDKDIENSINEILQINNQEEKPNINYSNYNGDSYFNISQKEDNDPMKQKILKNIRYNIYDNFCNFTTRIQNLISNYGNINDTTILNLANDCKVNNEWQNFNFHNFYNKLTTVIKITTNPFNYFFYLLLIPLVVLGLVFSNKINTTINSQSGANLIYNSIDQYADKNKKITIQYDSSGIDFNFILLMIGIIIAMYYMLKPIIDFNKYVITVKMILYATIFFALLNLNYQQNDFMNMIKNFGIKYFYSLLSITTITIIFIFYVNINLMNGSLMYNILLILISVLVLCLTFFGNNIIVVINKTIQNIKSMFSNNNESK
jgi:hypothetical protein